MCAVSLLICDYTDSPEYSLLAVRYKERFMAFSFSLKMLHLSTLFSVLLLQVDKIKHAYFYKLRGLSNNKN